MKRIFYIGLGAALLALLTAQLLSVAYFPISDSFRWFGDETWLMLESRAQLFEGVVRNPIAYGSTILLPKSFLLGSTWIRSVLYGAPSIVLHTDPLVTGRVVSTLFGWSLLLVIILYFYRHRAYVAPAAGLAAAILLATTRVFFFAVHSARPDILVGLEVLLLAIILERAPRFSVQRWFWLSLLLPLWSLGVSAHLPLSFALLFLIGYLLFDRRLATLAAIVAGVLAGLAVLWSLNSLLAGYSMPISQSGQASEFADITRDIPVLSLTSLNSLRTAFSRHIALLWNEAPIALFLLPLLFRQLAIALKATSTASAYLPLAALTLFFQWLLLERLHPAYTIHMLPLLIVAGLSSAYPLLRNGSGSKLRKAASFALIVAALGFGFFDAFHVQTTASALTSSNQRASEFLIQAAKKNSARPPLILVEAPALRWFAWRTDVRAMSGHFLTFPDGAKSGGEQSGAAKGIEQVLSDQKVDYVVMYNSPSYPFNRSTDSLYAVVTRTGKIQATVVGKFFDISRDYFSPSQDFRDSLLLYKLRN